MKRLFYISLALLFLPATGTGNESVAASGQPIVRSFTEPIERSVAAGAVTGVIVSASVREGDRVKAGQPLASTNRGVLEARLAIAKVRARVLSV